MRSLSDDEQALLEQRRARLDTLLTEYLPAIADFAESLGVQNGATAVADPDAFVDLLDAQLPAMDFGDNPDSLRWLQLRLAYTTALLLADRYQGCWFVNDLPDSRYFLMLVVGQFQQLPNVHAQIDPFDIAYAYMQLTPRPTFSKFIESIESELKLA